MGYSWIQGEDIEADVFTKQGSKQDALEEIVHYGKFKYALTKDNLVVYEDEEFKVRNLTTKRQKG